MEEGHGGIPEITGLHEHRSARSYNVRPERIRFLHPTSVRVSQNCTERRHGVAPLSYLLIDEQDVNVSAK